MSHLWCMASHKSMENIFKEKNWNSAGKGDGIFALPSVSKLRPHDSEE